MAIGKNPAKSPGGMVHKSELQRKFLSSGDVFTAMDRCGNQYTYRFLGLDLSDLEDGLGCRYIRLYNVDNDTETCVEALWFTQRLIRKKEEM